MAKPIFFILLVGMLFSCSKSYFTVERLAGEYKGNNYGGTIELRQDSTFYYHFRHSMLFVSSAGRWENNGRKIIFNDFKHLDSLYTLLECKSLNKDSIEIEVVNGCDAPLFNVYCDLYSKFNKRNASLTGFDGKCKFPKGDYDSLVINYPFNNSSKSFIIEDNKLDYYKIRTITTESFYRDFNNEKWKYRSGKIRNKRDSISKSIFIKQ